MVETKLKNKEELEELDGLKDSYGIEDKLFNMTVSQISEHSRKFLWGDF